ncbi:Alpha/beta hydrolase fold-3 domain protein [Segniliparus rotundus DSM 44985]|uniref:Alpha/beta hydrolase fold-3 domain protein n=1 Tax=Segniliparus rotundus (strain ATCC BAA-972 / CDC 1076 / CIP 108378 / DSM 44985 / JCM 13578) TaxID=640132 RepID=D6ZCB0_SEGRD|nr:alpha/beta hydrolase [Segniliparus rotundus]ADG99079.1 Alpha/beta hydrolase fold-3 domain protein [Segniliparus rotundus DSM 44985]
MRDTGSSVERFSPPSTSAQRINFVLRYAVRPLLAQLLSGLALLEEWAPVGHRAQLWHSGARRVLQLASAWIPSPRGVARSALTIRGVPVEQSVPTRPSGTTVLYLHGGAFVICGPSTHRRLVGQLAQDCGATVLAPDYRMLPQIPFTEILDDCVNVYRQMLDDGFDPKKVVIAGDSAGGYLTLATAQALRDAGLPLPAGLVAIAPWLDLRRSLRGEDRSSEVLIPWRQAQLVVQKLIAPLGPLALANPADGDLAGLPPTLVQVSAAELLFRDSTYLADRLAEAGVRTRLEIWHGQIHVFQALPDLNPDARRAIGNIAGFIRQVTAQTQPSA